MSIFKKKDTSQEPKQDIDDEILRLINTPIFNLNICYDSRISQITHVGTYGTPNANTPLSTDDAIMILQGGIEFLKTQKELTLQRQLVQQQQKIEKLEQENKEETKETE